MMRRNYILFFLILVLIFSLVFPGVVLAEENSIQKTNNTIVISAPEQTITGQTLTLVAQVRENEYNEPVVDGLVSFFVKTDFFISGLVEIGESRTDEQGFARMDYIPNQPGDLQVVASYKSSSDLEPVIAESMVIVSGITEPFYQSIIGIEFPNSFLIWMIVIVVLISVVWGFFLFIIYKVIIANISKGSKAKGVSIILTVSATVLFIVILYVLVTPEAQYNFGFLP